MDSGFWCPSYPCLEYSTQHCSPSAWSFWQCNFFCKSSSAPQSLQTNAWKPRHSLSALSRYWAGQPCQIGPSAYCNPGCILRAIEPFLSKWVNLDLFLMPAANVPLGQLHQWPWSKNRQGKRGFHSACRRSWPESGKQRGCWRRYFPLSTDLAESFN